MAAPEVPMAGLYGARGVPQLARDLRPGARGEGGEFGGGERLGPGAGVDAGGLDRRGRTAARTAVRAQSTSIARAAAARRRRYRCRTGAVRAHAAPASRSAARNPASRVGRPFALRPPSAA